MQLHPPENVKQFHYILEKLKNVSYPRDHDTCRSKGISEELKDGEERQWMFWDRGSGQVCLSSTSLTSSSVWTMELWQRNDTAAQNGGEKEGENELVLSLVTLNLNGSPILLGMVVLGLVFSPKATFHTNQYKLNGWFLLHFTFLHLPIPAIGNIFILVVLSKA